MKNGLIGNITIEDDDDSYISLIKTAIDISNITFVNFEYQEKE